MTEGPGGARGSWTPEALRPTPLPCKEGRQGAGGGLLCGGELQGAVQEAVYVAAADAAPAAAAAAAAPASRTALAVDSVGVSVLGALRSSEVATSNSHPLQSASLVPAGRRSGDARRHRPARPPARPRRRTWGPRAVDPPGQPLPPPRARR